MSKQVSCPYCNFMSVINVHDEYCQFRCNGCGNIFVERNGKEYKNEDIAPGMTYYIVAIFGWIAKADPEKTATYDNFVNTFISKQNITRGQFNDLKKTYSDEKKSMFGFLNKYKTYIMELKKYINTIYAQRAMSEQISAEDGICYLLLEMAKISGGNNEKQNEIIDCVKSVFEINDTRFSAIKGVQNTQVKPKITVDTNQVFIDLKERIRSGFIGTEKFLDELLLAYKRPFISHDSLSAAKNLVMVLSSEPDLVQGNLEKILNEMSKDLSLKNGIDAIDLNFYNNDSSLEDFIKNLEIKLTNNSEVLCFKNIKAASPKIMRILSELTVKGGISFSGYSLQLTNKYFFFLSDGDEDSFASFAGEDMLNIFQDVIVMDELSEEILIKVITTVLNNLIGKWNNELSMSLLWDKGIIPFLKDKYNGRTGIKGIELFITQNVGKPIQEYKLRTNISSEEKVILYVTNDIFYIRVSNEDIKLSDLVRKKKEKNVEEIKEKLNKIIGLETVKEFVLKLEDSVEANRARTEAGLKTAPINMNMIFTGNPGTGKTTVARIVAEYLKCLGVIEKGQLVETSRDDLVGEYQGNTAIKTKAVIESAIGGVLFIDEAYALCRDGNDAFGLEAVATLVKMMEDNKNNLVVVLAGYSKEMTDFLKSNSGLKSRFPYSVDFQDYTPTEMYKIANVIATDSDYIIDENCISPLISFFEAKNIKGKHDAGNGRLARNVVEKAILNQSRRIVNENETDYQLLTLSDFELVEKEEFNLEDNLSKIVGLENVKDFLRTQYNVLKAKEKRKNAGMPVDEEQALNMIFTGNPGTGKTTVARVVANMLKEMKVLKSGHLVEVSRSNLVAEYLGQTAPKTEEVFMSALGGILFVDEAYALSNGNDNFGKEAIDTLVKLIEDYRGEILVILAGYKKEMSEFLNVNSGLESRFPIIIDFPDYNSEDLWKIFIGMLKKRGFELTEEAKDCANRKIEALHKNSTAASGNGRMIRNYVDEIIRNQSNRIVKDDVPVSEVAKIISEDL